MTGDANTPALAIREMAMGYIRARALYAVAELGVADFIGDESVSIAELADATGSSLGLTFPPWFTRCSQISWGRFSAISGCLLNTEPDGGNQR